jgi:hypothetical protein
MRLTGNIGVSMTVIAIATCVLMAIRVLLFNGGGIAEHPKTTSFVILCDFVGLGLMMLDVAMSN